MSILDITSISTKGQIVIPREIRDNIGFKPGMKLFIIQEGENILLKPVRRPGLDDFKKIISIGDSIREECDLQKEDIERVIARVRKR